MFNIRPASIEEIPLLRSLVFRVWPQTYKSILSDAQIDYMLELMYSEESLRTQISEGSRFIFIEEDKEPVGYASYQRINKNVFKLHKLYVLPSQQGKGSGRAMVDYIISKIKEEGGSQLQLQVNRGNKARQFYEKLGFEIIEERDFDIGNGFVMDDYVMEKKI